MSEYERPRVLATYSADELAREAAACENGYGVPPSPSDRDLKDEIEEIEGALERIGSIRTR